MTCIVESICRRDIDGTPLVLMDHPTPYYITDSATVYNTSRDTPFKTITKAFFTLASQVFTLIPLDRRQHSNVRHQHPFLLLQPYRLHFTNFDDIRYQSVG